MSDLGQLSRTCMEMSITKVKSLHNAGTELRACSYTTIVTVSASTPLTVVNPSFIDMYQLAYLLPVRNLSSQPTFVSRCTHHCIFIISSIALDMEEVIADPI